MTPTNLPALREAVARRTAGELTADWHEQGVQILAGTVCIAIVDEPYNADAIVAGMNALPALLDEVEALRASQHTWPDSAQVKALKAEVDAERIENTHLREAFVTMERAANERELEAEWLRVALTDLCDAIPDDIVKADPPLGCWVKAARSALEDHD